MAEKRASKSIQKLDLTQLLSHLVQQVDKGCFCWKNVSNDNIAKAGTNLIKYISKIKIHQKRRRIRFDLVNKCDARVLAV